MSVTLTAEQFAELVESNSKGKKWTKKDLDNRKNAMDIEEFINNLKIDKISRLTNMELPDFMVAVILETLDKIEDDEMPFICANFQTKSYYYKKNGEWIKGTDFMTPIYNAIFKKTTNILLSNKYEYKSKNEDDEKEYEGSLNAEKQRIICNLCNVDKYPVSKCIEKILAKLGKRLKC
jgi:hypothetical protein